MSEKIIQGFADALTGEYSTKELQGEELSEFLANREKLEKEAEAKAKEKEAARAEVLAKLGLTLDDLAILGLVEKQISNEPASQS